MFNHENQQFFGVLLIAETGGSLIWIFYKKTGTNSCVILKELTGIGGY
jgi:hypothetical protein